MKHLPNLICLLRIALIWPIVLSLQAGEHVRVVVLFLVAAISDGLDGFLAKRFGWASDLGRFLDPLADKLLLVTVFVVATWNGLIPWWLTVAAVARDFIIGLGALVYRLWFGPLHGRPTIVSKINTLVQFSCLVAAILAAAWHWPPRELQDALFVFAFVLSIASGIDYLARFVGRAWRAPAATL
ncbi:MAG: CDP-alcohol phosphatidyltransferase family protein [Steroidobacteraceae bacterium]